MLGQRVWSASQSFAYGLQRAATDQQGDDRTDQQGLDDVRIAGVQFIEAIVRLSSLKVSSNCQRAAKV